MCNLKVLCQWEQPVTSTSFGKSPTLYKSDKFMYEIEYKIGVEYNKSN